jgi:S-adenosyl-L-methionine hydrolase (adenosine-forming)
MATTAPPTITLTTDFGHRDPWVAAMKGVITTIAPKSPLIDLSHGIGPQGVLEGALFLASAAPYFPAETVHLVVIDPGVGTDRDPIVAQCGKQYFVCPDNGLLTVLERTHKVGAVHRIENPDYRLPQCSATFHGRDIFAPAAAHVALGNKLDTFGAAIKGLSRIPVPEATMDAEDQLHGEVIHVDHFGNCITNIYEDMLGAHRDYSAQVAAQTLSPIHRTYADVTPGTPLALFGSTGHLEIAVSMSSAAKNLDLRPGSPVTLYRPSAGGMAK